MRNQICLVAENIDTKILKSRTNENKWKNIYDTKKKKNLTSTPILSNIFGDGITESKNIKNKTHYKKMNCSWKDYFELFHKEMSYHTEQDADNIVSIKSQQNYWTRENHGSGIER